MKISPYILLSLSSFFWSLNFIIGKILSELMPPTSISFFRWFLPFILFLPYSIKEIIEYKNIFLAKWPLLLFLGATGYCLNSISVYEAVRFTTTINTSFINAFNPVLIALVGFILYNNKLSKTQFLGFAFSLAGVLFIIFKGNLKLLFGLQVNIGDLFMLLSITLWAFHTVLYNKKGPDFPSHSMFTLMMLSGLLITLPLALAENFLTGWFWIQKIETKHILGILCLNLFPSVLAYQFWNSALKRVSPNKVGIFLYLVPVYTTIISVLFLNETLQPFHILGGILILSGVLLVTWTSHTPSAKAVE